MLGGIIPNWVKRHFEKFPFPKDLQIATNFISTSYEPDALELVPNESRELELTSKMDNSMDISRFFDWESFCLADRYGCGFVFVRLRARRQNVSSSDFRSAYLYFQDESSLPPKKYDPLETSAWCTRMFVGMVYERRVSNSLEKIFVSEQMFWSNIPPSLESLVSIDHPEVSDEENKPSVNEFECLT